jgi:hypothetical protein
VTPASINIFIVLAAYKVRYTIFEFILKSSLLGYKTTKNYSNFS